MDSSNALSRVVSRHLAHLHAIARRILGDEDLARDAVQEALVTLWRVGRVPAHTRAWLVRTVVHRSLHVRRSQVRRRHWEERAARESARDVCPLCDPARELENKQLLAALSSAFQRLMPEYRDVLLLREIEGLDYLAIAQRLSVPVGTVRSRLNRAREIVRESLRAEAGAG